MTSNEKPKVHWSFWVISVLFLIWNVLGCINLIVQLNPENIAAYRQNEQDLIQLRPLWGAIAFGVAVFCGAIGCLLLLLRRKLALYPFIVSLVAIFITIIPTFTSGISFSAIEIIGNSVLPVLVGSFLLWYTCKCSAKYWLA